jgi:hypothetical protein
MSVNEPRVFASAQKPRWPWLAVLLLIACVLFLLWPHTRKPAVESETKSKPEAEPKVVTQVEPQKVEREPVPALPPKPVLPPREKSKTPFKVTFKRAETYREGPGKIAVTLFCDFLDESLEETLYGIGSHGPVLELQTEKGNTTLEPWGFGSPTKLNARKAQLRLAGILKDGESRILKLEAEVALVRLKPREQLEWTELGPELIGKSLGPEGFTFTVSHYQENSQSVEAEVFSRFKPEVAGHPQLASQYYGFVEFKMRLADGSMAGRSGGSGGGMGENRYMNHLSFRLNGKKPAALQVSYVPEINVELAPFSLTDIEIPLREAKDGPVAAAPLKRGERSMTSNGYTFHLNRVDLSDNQEPSMRVSFLVTPPDGIQIVDLPVAIIGALARDNKGAVMKSYGHDFWSRPYDKVYATASFRYPDDEATAIDSLTGTFNCLIAEEVLSKEFDVSKTVPHTQPVVQGPVELKRFRIVEDVATFEYDVETAVLWNEKNKGNFVDHVLLDAAGNVIKKTGGGGNSSKERINIRSNQILNGAVPAKLIVRCVTKARPVQVPFEFKDIEIPRAASKIEYAQPAGDF